MEEAMPFVRHGAVQESIMALMHGVKGDRITAGVGRVQVYIVVVFVPSLLFHM
jgi:hypothetical protein